MSGTETLSALDGFAEAVGAIGTQRFDTALLSALNGLALVDHLTVLTWRPADGLRSLVVASRTDESQARSLTRDYVTKHHVLDPNFSELTRRSRSRQIIVRLHDPTRLRTQAYQRRFYTTVGIVDKVSLLWRTGEAAYYANLYRTQRSGHYTPAELRRLTDAARFIASTIRMHGGRSSLEAARAAGHVEDLVTHLVGLLSERLTPREQAVVGRILTGMRTEGIAIDLQLKPASIITFRKRAYAKLGISTQAELFARCLRALPRMPAPV